VLHSDNILGWNPVSEPGFEGFKDISATFRPRVRNYGCGPDQQLRFGATIADQTEKGRSGTLRLDDRQPGRLSSYCRGRRSPRRSPPAPLAATAADSNRPTSGLGGLWSSAFGAAFFAAFFGAAFLLPLRRLAGVFFLRGFLVFFAAFFAAFFKYFFASGLFLVFCPSLSSPS